MFMMEAALETLGEHQKKIYNMWVIKWDEENDGREDTFALPKCGTQMTFVSAFVASKWPSEATQKQDSELPSKCAPICGRICSSKTKALTFLAIF